MKQIMVQILFSVLQHDEQIMMQTRVSNICSSAPLSKADLVLEAEKQS
jgi:hypothetical protein